MVSTITRTPGPRKFRNPKNRNPVVKQRDIIHAQDLLYGARTARQELLKRSNAMARLQSLGDFASIDLKVDDANITVGRKATNQIVFFFVSPRVLSFSVVSFDGSRMFVPGICHPLLPFLEIIPKRSKVQTDLAVSGQHCVLSCKLEGIFVGRSFQIPLVSFFSLVPLSQRTVFSVPRW